MTRWPHLVALTFAVLDVAVGGYILWFAQMAYVAWKAEHPTVHKISVPTDPILR